MLTFPARLPRWHWGCDQFPEIQPYWIPNVDRNIVPLNETDLAFYSEAVFLLKTYFFVHLGISIHFS